MSAPTVVIGGGLAGISAALRLADSGRPVTLLEARPRLGGAAFSFTRDGLRVDNGQHVFLRCCVAYRGLIARLGAEHLVTLQDRLDIPVLDVAGRRGRLSRLPRVPAPAHLTAALAGYALLSPADRARAALGALALKRLDPADPSLDRRTLGSFLRAHGQNDATIDALWGIVATATLNLAPDEASLALAAKVFRTGLLDRADAADIGYARAPLGALHHDAALDALRAAGVDVRLGHRVRHVDAGDHPTVRAAYRSREYALAARDVVLALPHADAFAAVPALAGTAAAPAAGLGATAIVNVHVRYDRRVTDLPFAAGVGTDVQWFFDRTRSSGLAEREPRAQYLAVTVSAADALVGVPSRAITERFVAELARLVPDARRAEVTDAFVTRERRATFRQAAGSAALRPAPRSGPPGVLLAGAWTATGWPDTMESAVRSGIAAAEASLGVTAEAETRYAA